MSPPQSFEREQFTRLTAREIRKKLVGHIVFPDPFVDQARLDFVEVFLPDGTWTSTRAVRGHVLMSGTWRIDDDLICVARAGVPTQCREIWSERASGKIAMQDMGATVNVMLIMFRRPAP